MAKTRSSLPVALNPQSSPCLVMPHSPPAGESRQTPSWARLPNCPLAVKEAGPRKQLESFRDFPFLPQSAEAPAAHSAPLCKLGKVPPGVPTPQLHGWARKHPCFIRSRGSSCPFNPSLPASKKTRCCQRGKLPQGMENGCFSEDKALFPSSCFSFLQPRAFQASCVGLTTPPRSGPASTGQGWGLALWDQDENLEGPGTSLVVQRLRLHAPSAGGPGSIPGRGTRSHMPQLKVHMPQLKILRAPAGSN